MNIINYLLCHQISYTSMWNQLAFQFSSCSKSQTWSLLLQGIVCFITRIRRVMKKWAIVMIHPVEQQRSPVWIKSPLPFAQLPVSKLSLITSLRVVCNSLSVLQTNDTQTQAFSLSLSLRGPPTQRMNRVRCNWVLYIDIRSY